MPQTMYVLTNLEPNGNIVHWVVGNYETLHNGWNRVIPMEGAFNFLDDPDYECGFGEQEEEIVNE